MSEQQALAEQFDAAEVVEEVIEQQAEQGGEQTPEEQARLLGWRPKEEMKDPSKFVDAESFLKVREENLAVANRDNKRLNEVNRDLNKKVKRLEGMIEQVKGFEQRAYQRALDDLTAKQREAVQTGDLEAHDAVSKEMDALRKDMVAEEKKKDEPAVDTGEIFAEWLADNDWYARDEVKRTYADAQIKKLGPMPDYDDGPEAYLEKVTELVSARFAKKVEKINPVGAANGMRAAAKGGKGYADLPGDAKQMAQQMVKAGIFKSNEDYAKEYFNG